MLKLINNIVRRGAVRGRDTKAPALLARPKALLKGLFGRLGRSSGGCVLVSAGVIAAAVAVVSLLTLLAPDSDRPFIARPVQAVVQSVLPGVQEQVEGGVAQVATLLGVDQESVVQNVRESVQDVGENMREGLTAAHSGSISDSRAPATPGTPAAGTATTTTSASEEPSSSSLPATAATEEATPPPLEPASEPSAPSSSSGGGTGEVSAPAVSPTTDEATLPTASEPTSEPTSPSVTEKPSPPSSPPPPSPAAEEPPAPPTAEEPPPPPVVDQPEA